MMFCQRSQLLLSRTLSVGSTARNQACNNNIKKNANISHRRSTVTLPAQISSSYRAVSTMSTSESTFSFWNTTTALIAAVVATSDYVSPNKTTDCCGNKGSSSYSFNNNNSNEINEKDSDDGDVENVANNGYHSIDRGGGGGGRCFNNNNGGGGGGPILHPTLLPPLHPPHPPYPHPPYPHQQYEPYKPNGSYHQFNNNGQSYPLSSTTLSSALTLPPPQQATAYESATTIGGVSKAQLRLQHASPHIVDVVFGNINPNHPGNVVYERLINSFRQRYIISRDALVKETISESIVRAIQGKGGRFLEFIISDIDGRPRGKWYAIGDSQAVSRTAQELSNRNNNPNLFATAVGASAFAPPIKSPPQQLVHRQPHHQQPHQPGQACPPQQQVQQPLQMKPHVPLQYHPVPAATHVQQSYHPPQHYHPTPTPAAAPIPSLYIQEQQRLEQQQLYDRHHPTPTPVHPPQQHQHYNPYTGSDQVMTPTQSYHHPPVFQQSTRHVARMSYSPNQGQQLEYSVPQQVTQQPQQQFAAPPPATNNNWGNFTESVSDVRPDQIAKSTSEAMSNYIDARYFSESLSSSNDMGDDFTESLSFLSSSAAIKQNIILEFWRDKFRNKLEVLPDLNISASTLNVPSTTTPNVQTTTTHKRKGERKSPHDFSGGVYVEPSDDCQDYSKSHRLVYEKGHPAKRLKSDGAAMDIEKFIEGGGFLHATSAKNLFCSPTANLAPHNFGVLDGGIFANGLKPMVQADKKSKKPMEAVWVMPYGRATSSIAHIVNTHGPSLEASDGWVALIMIPADDDRMKNFIPLRTGSIFCKTCHPAYSYGEIPVSPKDVLIVNINDLPVFLKETKVRTDLIPLKTDKEKKATRDLCNNRRYAASTNRPVKRHTHTRGARCTDATLGPNGVLQCRFDNIAHSHSKKKGVSRLCCALHKWAGTRKTSGIVHCETCNVHLCTDCFTTFHTHFDFVAVRKQLKPSTSYHNS